MVSVEGESSPLPTATKSDYNDIVVFFKSVNNFGLINETTATFLREWLFPLTADGVSEGDNRPTLADIEAEIPALKAIYEDLTIADKVYFAAHCIATHHTH